ncbi:hypothetical protein GQ53DRAFT_793515 [Thozetella sp. PMI_491]|nr:hypothetical protein GQ53DRAFT_793515 [Thozetella sp. PMI_491]
MPLPGAQHSSSITNPFEEPQRRMSEYTAQEIATLQSRLEKKLGPEYLSSRAGPSGQKVHYVSAEKCIALANEVFGFNGWSSSIQNIQVDFVDENPQTLKISLGMSVIVRVTLRDGTYHEDIGYGHIENCKGKAAAFEKAKKEGTTDALKRALRNFGNVLGNCIYDKAYLAKVTKLKAEPAKFDEATLHRHSDYAVKVEPTAQPRQNVSETPKTSNPELPKPANTESSKETLDGSLLSSDSFEELMSELDEADFNMMDDGHPDEVILGAPHQNSGDKPSNPPQPAKSAPMQPPSRPITKSSAAVVNGRQPQTPNPPHPRPGQFHGAHQQQHNQGVSTSARPQPQGQNNISRPNNPPQAALTAAASGPQNAATNGPPSGTQSAGFFSARAVTQIPEETLSSQQFVPQTNHAFNPHAESPSIRKTPGIDHTKSRPLARNGQHVVPTPSADNSNPAGNSNPSAPRPGPTAAGGQAPIGRPGGPGPGPSPGPRGNGLSAQFDHGRRIGAPMGSASPLANRNQYRPPTMKRPVGQEQGAQNQLPGRPPLADVSSNNPPTGQTGSGHDIKRQRVA